MRNSRGAAFTVDVEEHPGTGAIRVKKRPVTPPEIRRLEAQGVTLAYLADPEEAQTGVAAAVDKQGYPAATVPTSFTIMRLYGTTYGGFWTTAARPAGKTTHWSSFNFKSTGYSLTDEHVAHSLVFNGALGATELNGNGMIIGMSYGRTVNDGGCGSSVYPQFPRYNTQVEAFWALDNWIYGNTCSPDGLLDGVTYNVALHANIYQDVTYWIRRNGQTVFVSPPVNTAARRPTWDPSQAGVLFTVMGIPAPDFSLRFTNVATGWF